MNEANITTEELKGMSLEEIATRINAAIRDADNYKTLYEYASRECAKKQAKLDAITAVMKL